jgi:hypothetical protein
MLFIRIAGGLFSWCVRWGGVGAEVGRSLEAALRRAVDGSREEMTDEECFEAVSAELELMTGAWKGFVGVLEPVGEGGDVGG